MKRIEMFFLNEGCEHWNNEVGLNATSKRVKRDG
jgi:hypothetical protein